MIGDVTPQSPHYFCDVVGGFLKDTCWWPGVTEKFSGLSKVLPRHYGCLLFDAP